MPDTETRWQNDLLWMALAWSLAPSHSGLFAVKISGVRAIVIEALCFTSNRVFSPPATFFELIYCFGSYQSFVDGNQTHVHAVHPRKSRGCATAGNSAHKKSEYHECVVHHPTFTGTGCSNHNYRVCLFSLWLCPQWQQFHRTVGRVECSALDTNSRRLRWWWQFWANRGSLQDALDMNFPQSSQKDMFKYFMLASWLIPSTTYWRPERRCQVFQRILCGWPSG